MIGRSGERWSGISVQAARHDDDDDDDDLIIIMSSYHTAVVSDIGMKPLRKYAFCYTPSIYG